MYVYVICICMYAVLYMQHDVGSWFDCECVCGFVFLQRFVGAAGACSLIYFHMNAVRSCCDVKVCIVWYLDMRFNRLMGTT